MYIKVNLNNYINNMNEKELKQLLRLILTNSNTGPNLFLIMEILGKETVISRIEKFIKYKMNKNE